MAEKSQGRGVFLFFFKLKYAFVVQLLSHVQLFGIPRTGAHQVSLSFTISWSLFKLMSIESVMPSNHLILRHPLLLPSIFEKIRVFSNESVLHVRWQSIRASASVSVLPMKIQAWYHLGLTGLIFLLSKGFSRVFESINLSLLSLLYGQILTSVHDYWKDYSFDHMPFVNKVMSLSL